jgi:hypothetical protein
VQRKGDDIGGASVAEVPLIEDADRLVVEQGEAQLGRGDALGTERGPDGAPQ